MHLSLTVSNFVLFFMLLDGKFNGNFKNVLKTVIFILEKWVLQAILS